MSRFDAVRFRRWSINLLLACALVLFFVGILAPIITIKKLLVVQNTFSILSGTVSLLREGDIVLFSILFLFSMVFPLCKVLLLFKICNQTASPARRSRELQWLSFLGKWSMLDVFVVAVLVTTVKLGALANVRVHFGLYMFAFSILSTMAATSVIQRQATSRGQNNEFEPPNPDERSGLI